GRAGALEHGRGARPAEDLRGPPPLQRRDVHRRVPDAGIRDGAEAVRVRLQREGEPLGDHGPRVSEGEAEAARLADELRPADHRGGGGELREPGRVAAGAPARGAGPEAPLRPGPAEKHPDIREAAVELVTTRT